MNGGTKKTGGADRDRAQVASSAAERIERELERHLEVLAGLLASGDWSEADVENRLGWQRGHVRQLLTRQLPLEYGDLLAILEVIGVELKEFFILVTSPETEH